jgi:hypothetical protein
MKRRPDPTQSLFPWVWSGPEDDRPDRPADDIDELEDDDLPPPLRDRVAIRHAPTVVRELWSVPVVVRNAGAYSRK